MLLILIIGAIAGVAFGGIGVTLALRARNASTVQGIFPIVFVILFISSAFFPSNLLEQPAKALADYNPLSYIADGLRDPIISAITAKTVLEGMAAGAAVALVMVVAGGARPAREARDVRQSARVVRVLMRRGLNEILRVPGAALPGVLAPTIFMIGLSGVFGAAARLRGFPAVEGFRTYIVPVGLLQGAGFTGAATGVNLARDIEQGWFDRLLVAPVPRVALLLGTSSPRRCARCCRPACC